MTADLGSRMRKRRQIIGLTQQELARQLGVSKSTVANWESGKHFPLRYMGKVEEVLGISLDDEEQMPVIVAAHQNDPRVMELWSLRSIPPRSREGLIATLLEQDGPLRKRA
jgi:transcriptional regulator with XRE-family HTH domain